jgi:nickel-dependent lactate racemase
MVFAARAARLSFICNVVLNAQKRVVYAVAGDCIKAHETGCYFLRERCGAQAVKADISVTTNGGYPLDQNVYQTVKGMTAAEVTVRKGGVIIMLSRSEDGHGGEEFLRAFAEEPDHGRLLERFRRTPRDHTRIDQWQSQIFARVLSHADVVYVSDAPDDMIRVLHMTPAHSLDEALRVAETKLNNPNATIVAIPDGVGVIIEKLPAVTADFAN